jgi:hypothetical protein
MWCDVMWFAIPAPDPEEDPEAQRAMENLATLAAQVSLHTPI